MLPSARKHLKMNRPADAAREKSFSAIMSETTRDMSWYARMFSRCIHFAGVSSLSTFASRIVARPNAILFGSIFSFSLTLSVYLLSKNLGYSLSGFESIGTFFIGWICGILFDILSPLFVKKK